MAKAKADIITTNLDSIITFEAGTRKGRKWLTANVNADEQIVCEHRFADDIMRGALDDGMRLQDGATGMVAYRAS